MTQPPPPPYGPGPGQPYQADPPPKKSNRVLWLVIGGIVASCIIGLAVQVIGDRRETDAATAATSEWKPPPTTPPVTPATYELIEDGRQISMMVTTDNRAALEAAWNVMFSEFVKTHPEDGYFVYIDCAVGPAGNRLGVGKIAIGKIGQARTGLGAPGATVKYFGDVEWNNGRTCNPDMPIAPTVARTATATPSPDFPAGLDPRCSPAPADLVDRIAAKLNDGDHRVAHAVVVDGPDGTYIGASVVASDGLMIERSDVWVDTSRGLVAASSGAKRTTSLPNAISESDADTRDIADLCAWKWAKASGYA